MEWISQNFALVSIIAYVVLNIAAVVVAQTTNTVDNKIVKIVREVLLRFSLVKEDENGKLVPGVPLFTGSKSK